MKKNSTLTDPQIDQAWWSLIELSEKAHSRIGKYHNRRYDRYCVYTCENLQKMACMMVESGVLKRWQGGIRKLSRLEIESKELFRKKHGQYHTDA